MRIVSIVVVSLMLLASAAFAGSVKITPDQVLSKCRGPAGESCAENCVRYKAAVEAKTFASKRECRHACVKVYQDIVNEAGGTSCEGAAGAGEDICTMYCNQNYAK
jgi:hypothetical protein